MLFTPDVIIRVDPEKKNPIRPTKKPQKRRHPLGNERCAIWYPAQISRRAHSGKVEPGLIPLVIFPTKVLLTFGFYSR